jgi:hypothetical protein
LRPLRLRATTNTLLGDDIRAALASADRPRKARSRAVLHLERLALRHQVQALQRSQPRRLPIRTADRWLWVWLSRFWTAWWRTALVIVRRDAVVAGFRFSGRGRAVDAPVDRASRPTCASRFGRCGRCRSASGLDGMRRRMWAPFQEAPFSTRRSRPFSVVTGQNVAIRVRYGASGGCGSGTVANKLFTTTSDRKIAGCKLLIWRALQDSNLRPLGS